MLCEAPVDFDWHLHGIDAVKRGAGSSGASARRGLSPKRRARQARRFWEDSLTFRDLTGCRGDRTLCEAPSDSDWHLRGIDAV